MTAHQGLRRDTFAEDREDDEKFLKLGALDKHGNKTYEFLVVDGRVESVRVLDHVEEFVTEVSVADLGNFEELDQLSLADNLIFAVFLELAFDLGYLGLSEPAFSFLHAHIRHVY